ncbi:MAG: DNA-deoxyinosine glycosylase [Alphaproteobacteria bacterium]
MPEGLLAGFAPIACADARVLVLGSMPGAASLEAGRYYAHPRNAFWPIMAALVGFDPAAAYAERAAALKVAGVALWDVLGACRRDGSLDTAIEPATMVVNDFAGFFQRHPEIARVFFNGAKAAELFRRRVAATALPAGLRETRRLPSTSPANARLRFADKLKAWRVVAAALEQEARTCPPSTRPPSMVSARSSTGAAR